MLVKYVLVVQTCTVLVSSNMRQKRQFQFNLGQLFGPQPQNNNGQINNGQRIDLGAVAGNILGNILQRPKQTDGSSTPIPPLNGFINDFVGTALNNTDIQLGFENGNLQVAINPVNRPQENGRPDFNYDCDGQLFRRFPDRDRRRGEQVVCPCWRFGLIPDNNNLNIINNPSQENNPFSCKQKCDNTPECAAWTFKESRRRRNFNCFLKSSSANLFTVDDFVSGVKNCGQPGGQPQPQPTQAPLISAPLTSCRTVSGANNGALCVLPFTHKGITHTKCTLDDADDGKPWCSTLTDGTGQHIGGQGQWGHCIPECSENQGLVIIPITEEKPAPGPVPGCGAYTKRFQTRIVGGKPADPNEWPWLAALLRPSSTGSGQYCGGTLISDTHVLTAAHCVVIFKTEEIQVKLGEYDFNAAGETQDQQYAVQSVIVHQQYNNATYENDIAILKLASPITRTKSVFPICLPQPNEEFEGQKAWVIGWGTIFFGGPASDVLREVEVDVWNQQKCAANYQNIGRSVLDTMMCAGSPGVDSCQGDSGGPLNCKNSFTGSWSVCGVVSWGAKCAEEDFPGVYTRVSKYLDWINSNTFF